MSNKSGTIIAARYLVTKTWVPPQRLAELTAEVTLVTSLRELANDVVAMVEPCIKKTPRDVQGCSPVPETPAQVLAIEGTAPSLLLEDDQEEGESARAEATLPERVGWRYGVVSEFVSFVGATGIQYKFAPVLSDRIARENARLLEFINEPDTTVDSVKISFEFFKGLIVTGLLGGVPEVRERWELATSDSVLTLSLWSSRSKDPWDRPGESCGGKIADELAVLVQKHSGFSLGELGEAGRKMA